MPCWPMRICVLWRRDRAADRLAALDAQLSGLRRQQKVRDRSAFCKFCRLVGRRGRAAAECTMPCAQLAGLQWQQLSRQNFALF